MLRKKLTILFLLIAQIIILGHGVIPHHHHDKLASAKHHHHDHDSKKQHPEETPLEQAFSGFLHAGEQVTFTSAAPTEVVTSKTVSQSSDILPADYMPSVEHILWWGKHTYPPDCRIIFRPPLYGAHSLRGPPTFIVARLS